MTLGSTGGWRKEQSASNLQELLISDERGRGGDVQGYAGWEVGFLSFFFLLGLA